MVGVSLEYSIAVPPLDMLNDHDEAGESVKKIDFVNYEKISNKECGDLDWRWFAFRTNLKNLKSESENTNQVTITIYVLDGQTREDETFEDSSESIKATKEDAFNSNWNGVIAGYDCAMGEDRIIENQEEYDRLKAEDDFSDDDDLIFLKVKRKFVLNPIDDFQVKELYTLEDRGYHTLVRFVIF